MRFVSDTLEFPGWHSCLPNMTFSSQSAIPSSRKLDMNVALQHSHTPIDDLARRTIRSCWFGTTQDYAVRSVIKTLWKSKTQTTTGSLSSDDQPSRGEWARASARPEPLAPSN